MFDIIPTFPDDFVWNRCADGLGLSVHGCRYSYINKKMTKRTLGYKALLRIPKNKHSMNFIA